MKVASINYENYSQEQTKKPRTVSLPPSRPVLRMLNPNTTRPILASARPVYQDPQLLECYAGEIYEHLSQVEAQHLPTEGYMKQQEDVNYKMRAILVDWLVTVHQKFKMLPETLFLTVNILDRYLSKKSVTRQQLQLVGVTSMLIASKYEEIYPPEVKDYVYITDKAYTREQILKLEVDILNTLEFNVTTPTSWRFLEYYAKQAELDTLHTHLAQYLLELSLVEYHMLAYKPSLLAASAVYISLKIQRRDASWGDKMLSCTHMPDTALKPGVKDMLVLFQTASKHTLTGVREKFAKREFGEASKMRLM